MTGPRLVLMCGLAGSGKSTYARGLEERGWLRFSVDAEAWELGLREVPLPAEAHAAILDRQRSAVAAALREGRDVVVDHSFWSRARRDDYRVLGHECGADVTVVWADTPIEEIRDRLARRRTEHADDVVVPPEVFEGYVAGFEPPGPDETDVTRLSGLRPG